MSLHLYSIQSLLNEFYLADTPNFRKREIETELIHFKQHANFSTLQLCLKETVTLENNQFLWFFCTSVLSHTITRRWSKLIATDRALIRDTLWKAYVDFQNNSKIRRDTIATLIAQIGKREFPDDHDYFLCVSELIKAHFVLGINLLRITFEEINREDLTTERKKYFNACACAYIPQLIDLITKYLLISVCHVNGKEICSALGTFPATLTSEINILVPTLPKDNKFSLSLLELLSCCQQLLPCTLMNTDCISDIFLMSILDLAKYREELPDCSFSSISVINELFYLQKPLPSALITSTLITGISALLEHNNSLKPQNEMYIDKFRELLRLFTAKYWEKMLCDNNILFERFLNSIYFFTIQRNGALDFTEKLEIWCPIVKVLSKQNHYNEIFLQLVSEIVHRIQFESNKSELELLENEIVDESTQTEWQQFLTQCIEFVAIVAEARPNSVFSQIAGSWIHLQNFLIDCEHDIDAGKSFELSRKLNSSKFGEILKDFSTICQTLARIAPLFELSESHYVSVNSRNYQVENWADNLIVVLKFFTRNKLMQINVDKSCLQDYFYLFAQILMAIQTLLTLPIGLKNENLQQILLIELGNIFRPETAFSPIVYIAASQLLLCISSVIRPKNFLETPSIMTLMQIGPNISHLPSQAIANIYIAYIAFLILPWKNLECGGQQDFPNRCVILREYVSTLSKSLLEIQIERDVQENVLSDISNQFLIYSKVLSFFKDSNNTSKEMLAVAFKPIITKSLELYNSFGNSNITFADSVIEINLSALRTLCFAHLGTQFIQNIIELFINVNNRQKLNFSHYSSLEKILQIFQILIEQPGNASYCMLPSILDFTFKYILPLIQDNAANSSNIVTAVYNLFDGILIHKWQYFYKSNIHLNGSFSASNVGENLHADHFTALLNAYGQVLISSSDPNVVHQVLQSMKNVNDRWRLYQRPLFKDNLLSSFQAALINMLISDQGSLHFDLLASALFAMSDGRSLKLREQFMTAGFPVNLKIIDEICLSTDIPTFSQKLTQLIQDVSCVQTT